jgi:hypothetical protein
MLPLKLTRSGTSLRRLVPRRVLAVAATVLLGLPGAAYPISLSHLLRLPLEELLRLEITAPGAAPRLRSAAPQVLSARPAGHTP